MINLPIYTINKPKIRPILDITGDRSKLTACVKIENESNDLSKESSLSIFGFERDGNGGRREFVKNTSASKSGFIMMPYHPFILPNMEEKIINLNSELAKPEHINYRSLSFIPELISSPLPDGSSSYSLIFAIYSSALTQKELIDSKDADKWQKFLSKVGSLNPSPPRRPSDRV